MAIEALVGDGISGPGLGGEVLRVTPGGQSTLTTNTSPTGSPDLDAPSDMAFLPDGNIVVTDEGFIGFVPNVIEVNPSTGARTLISGGGRGSGPALAAPDSVAVEASGDILVADEGADHGGHATPPDRPGHRRSRGPVGERDGHRADADRGVGGTGKRGDLPDGPERDDHVRRPRHRGPHAGLRADPRDRPRLRLPGEHGQ